MADIDIYRRHITKPKKITRRSILLKGPSGSGKSYQFRKLVEGGWKGVYACVSEHSGTVDDLFDDAALRERDLEPERWPIKQLDIPLSPTEKAPLKQDFILLLDYLRTPDHPYDFLFFDSLMNYADELEAYLKHDRRLTGYDLWGVFGEKLKMVLKKLVSLTDPDLPKPVHVIATWGVEVDSDWEGKRSKEPIVSGKMVRPRISYYFDDVFMLQKKEKADGDIEYFMYTGGTHEFDAKVSSGRVALPTTIVDPNLYRVIQKIRGEL